MGNFINSFMAMMKSEVTLYMYIAILLIGLVVTVVGFKNYRRKMKSGEVVVGKRYLILPGIGIFLIVSQIIQIGIYFMVVKIW